VSWRAWAEENNTELRVQDRWRECCALDMQGPHGVVNDRAVISFASNDYLGLSQHPTVVAAAHAAIDRWGTGAGASRLVTGTRRIHVELEYALAATHHVDRALLFPTGYAANIGVLSSLGTADVTIFSDALNHASIIDGCRLARARTIVYRHGDSAHLQSLLSACTTRKLIVTESVFSMDGDRAPLQRIAELAIHHGALLVVDEAHSVFPEHALPQIDGLELIRVGTLSKTLGAMGGWVGGSQSLIDLLTNTARSFIFTTALAPADAAAALAALQIYSSLEGEQLRTRLRQSIARVRRHHESPIVPIIVGTDADALRAAKILLDHGVYVPAIRPPTVAPGTARLRVTLSAAHDATMLAQLHSALQQAGLAA
jgi:8-amino-7-oxononanoate synthase